MSYSIYIGQAKLREDDPDDRDGELVAQYHVDGVASPDAPTFENDEMTGNGNARHPGYGAWSDFTKSVGLHDFFFDKERGLMRRHPGCFILTEDHAKEVATRLRIYRAQYPEAKPGFARKFMVNSGIIMSDSRAMGAPDPVVAEYHLARLIWLDWWIRWALANCKKPVIYNH